MVIINITLPDAYTLVSTIIVLASFLSTRHSVRDWVNADPSRHKDD